MLYRAMRPLHFTPPQVDEMELWQIAVELGMDEDTGWTPFAPPVVPVGIPDGTGPVLRSVD